MVEAKKGRGCFFYGCITSVVLGIVAVVAIVLAAKWGISYALNKYTSKTPIAVAPVSLSPAEGDPVRKRAEEFRKLLENGQAPAPLELTGEELDYVMRNSKEGGQLKDSIHMVITNDQIHADLSLPLGLISPSLAGHFLNGRADLGLSIREGAVVINLKGIEINGQPAPPEFIASLQKQGIEWKPKASEPGAALVRNLGDIEIKDGKIILKPKNAVPAESPAPVQP